MTEHPCRTAFREMRLVSWNVLADAYVRPGYFPHTPPGLLRPGQRTEGIVARIEALAPDVLCLQEVEPAVYRALMAGLGMAGHFAQKAGKPDGCAVFVRAPLGIGKVREVRYTDGSTSANRSRWTVCEARPRNLAIDAQRRNDLYAGLSKKIENL